MLHRKLSIGFHLDATNLKTTGRQGQEVKIDPDPAQPAFVSTPGDSSERCP